MPRTLKKAVKKIILEPDMKRVETKGGKGYENKDIDRKGL
jgi:hypothetical protein